MNCKKMGWTCLLLTFLILSFPASSRSGTKLDLKPKIAGSWQMDTNFFRGEFVEQEVWNYLIQPGIELGFEAPKTKVSFDFTLDINEFDVRDDGALARVRDHGGGLDLRAHAAGAPGGLRAEVERADLVGDAFHRRNDLPAPAQQAVDDRQKDEQVGAEQRSDQGREQVIIAEPDFIDADCIILVDDRDGPHVEQRVDHVADVKVTRPLVEVFAGQ